MDALRAETDAYLKRKGKLSAEQTDERLINLIKSHTTTSIAVAACGHAISSARFITLLSTDLQPSPENSDDLASYFQVLAASSRVNERVVSAGHEIWSSALLPFAGSVYSWPSLSDQCKSFEALFRLSMISLPPRLLSLAHVGHVIQKASSFFSRALAKLVYDGKWIHAYRSSRWLSGSWLLFSKGCSCTPACHDIVASKTPPSLCYHLHQVSSYEHSRCTDALRYRNYRRHHRKAASPLSKSGIHCFMRSPEASQAGVLMHHGSQLLFVFKCGKQWPFGIDRLYKVSSLLKVPI